MSKIKKQAELIFEQDYLKSRVILTEQGEYDIEFAILDGNSIGITEPNEFQAKAIYAGLDAAYRAKLKELQEEMLEALSKISDSVKEDESSDTEEHTHISDNSGGES
jgi:hypothetical protein